MQGLLQEHMTRSSYIITLNFHIKGKKSNKRQFDTYGETYGKGDTIGCFINCDQGIISFSKNGTDLGMDVICNTWLVFFTSKQIIFPPNHCTGPAFEIPLRGFAYYPAICLKNAELVLNFGIKPFKYNPGPYSGLANAPLAHTTLGLASSSKKGYAAPPLFHQA